MNTHQTHPKTKGRRVFPQNLFLLVLMMAISSLLLNYRFSAYLIDSSTEPKENLAIGILRDGSYLHKYSSQTSKQNAIFPPTSIPLVIWQTAISHSPPPLLNQQIIDTWKTLNPQWTRYLLDDEELEIFMSAHFNDTVVESFLKLPLPVMKADFFRLAVMYFNGGVYADVDVACNEPIHQWSDNSINKCGAIVGMENPGNFCNWGFAARPNHILFQTAMQLSLDRFVNAKWNYSDDCKCQEGVWCACINEQNEHFVHTTTGPGIFTDAFIQLSKEAGCQISEKVILDAFNTGQLAKELYDHCRDVLKIQYNLCLYDQGAQEGWFKNHYSSQRTELQSEGFVRSWTKERGLLIGNIKNNHVQNASKTESNGPWIFEAESSVFSHSIGSISVDQDGWLATPRDASGHMLYGPYTRLIPTGSYSATFSAKLVCSGCASAGSDIVNFDVSDSTQHVILGHLQVRYEDFLQEGLYQDFDIMFSIDLFTTLEFRAFYQGNGNVTIDKVTILLR